MDNRLAGEIKERLSSSKRILITSHIRPDGDAVGSLLGLGLALQDAGKSVRMVLVDGVPSSFRFLEGSGLIQQAPEGEFDAFVTVDCADFKRTGKAFEGLRPPDINIDHHITNERFGRINLIEAEEVATAAILTNHMPQWGLTITKPVAAALLTGIVTDTLGFRTSNTTPEALRQAADLMEKGVDLPQIYMNALVKKSFPAAKYWGAGLSSLQSSDGIVWGTLTLEDRKSAGYGGNDDADLINMISAIDGNKVGMVFVQQKDNHVKISWRALEPGVDVSQVAKFFNGGGHAAAAGADVEGSLNEVQQTALKKTRELINLQG